MTDDIIARLTQARVVPVVRTGSIEAARSVIGWLREAGIGVFEITMTVPDAPRLIGELAADPTLLIGAGTVGDEDAARLCLDAGARFIVAPWVDPALARVTRRAGAILMLGAMTPTEVRAALAAGADVVKVFPAASAGGARHVRALRSIFPGVRFCPTGGIEPGDVAGYLAAGAAFVGMGGALVGPDRNAVDAAARALSA